MDLEGHCHQEKNMNRCAEEDNMEHVPWLQVGDLRASEMGGEDDWSQSPVPDKTHILLIDFVCHSEESVVFIYILASETTAGYTKWIRAEQDGTQDIS